MNVALDKKFVVGWKAYALRRKKNCIVLEKSGKMGCRSSEPDLMRLN